MKIIIRKEAPMNNHNCSTAQQFNKLTSHPLTNSFTPPPHSPRTHPLTNSSTHPLIGRVASLLEVGTGFYSELTGRENIYFNGIKIKGMVN
jgi:hypothetical protein